MLQSNLKIELLETWEATYKKGQLTLWVFLALKEGEKYVSDIKDFVETNSQNTITCEEQSLYRTLRKFKKLGMVDYHEKEGFKGPNRKYYVLTNLGLELLHEFTERNIKLFFNENLKNLLFNKQLAI